MTTAPYPDLDEDLHGVVRAIDATFHTRPELLPAAEFREMVETLSRQTDYVAPEGVTTIDWVCRTATQPVRVRFYLPETWHRMTVYMHGGGWTVGSIEGHDQICADLAAQSGCGVASIDYALSPEARYPVALNQCLDTYAAIEAGDAPLPKVPLDIAVGGDSCGANLALAICLKRRDGGAPLPSAMALVYPCTEPDFTRRSYTIHADAPFLSTSLMQAFWHNYLGPDLQGDVYAWPGRAGLCGLPPAVVLTAALDPLVDEGDALAAELERDGVTVRHQRAERLIHGFLRFRSASRRARDAFSWLASELARI